jgi:hypothetical protein
MFLDINLHIKDVHLGYQESFLFEDANIISTFNSNSKKMGFRLLVHNLSIGHKYFMDETAYYIFSRECLNQLFIQMPTFEEIYETNLSSVEYGVLVAPFYFYAHPFFSYKREQLDFLINSKN